RSWPTSARRTSAASSAASRTVSPPPTARRSPSPAPIPPASRWSATRSPTSATAGSPATWASRPGTPEPVSAPRDLRLLSGAVLLSAAGDLLMVVVLSLRVHDLTGSGFAVAAVFATLMAPIVLLAPLAGRLVDRTETRRLLLAVSAAQALV